MARPPQLPVRKTLQRDLVQGTTPRSGTGLPLGLSLPQDDIQALLDQCDSLQRSWDGHDLGCGSSTAESAQRAKQKGRNGGVHTETGSGPDDGEDLIAKALKWQREIQKETKVLTPETESIADALRDAKEALADAKLRFSAAEEAGRRRQRAELMQRARSQLLQPEPEATAPTGGSSGSTSNPANNPSNVHGVNDAPLDGTALAEAPDRDTPASPSMHDMGTVAEDKSAPSPKRRQAPSQRRIGLGKEVQGACSSPSNLQDLLQEEQQLHLQRLEQEEHLQVCRELREELEAHHELLRAPPRPQAPPGPRPPSADVRRRQQAELLTAKRLEQSESQQSSLPFRNDAAPNRRTPKTPREDLRAGLSENSGGSLHGARVLYSAQNGQSSSHDSSTPCTTTSSKIQPPSSGYPKPPGGNCGSKEIAETPRPSAAGAPHLVRHWKVVGGVGKGGIIVREGADLQSEQLEERLSTGAFVEAKERIGERLRYVRLTGSGPETGWVSIRLAHKELLIQAANSVARCPPRAEDVERTDPRRCLSARGERPTDHLPRLPIRGQSAPPVRDTPLDDLRQQRAIDLGRLATSR
eukprot:TRINITY_DN106261_c0_g1_i1.p1 TRINITY_DN106261_c0_g1~~TRINITY_DN106261_c0_g1_i1.p1  ORF type:complete len:591 (+),score=117.41 TRINITY_DN106261_c0_g1_i1:29-1774(+)